MRFLGLSKKIISSLFLSQYAYMLEYRAEIALWSLSGILPFIMLGLWSNSSVGLELSLKGFDFSYCPIPQFVIPDYVPNFEITTLYLNDQFISDFSSIVNMTTLEDVNLEYNQISSLPSNFCNLVENPSTVKLTGNILDCSEIPTCNSGTVICD